MTGRYDSLFVTRMRECRDDMINEGDAAGMPLPPNLSEPWAVTSAMDVPDAKAYITTSWVHPVDHEVLWVHEHVHDYDEVLTFTGSDMANPKDLGAQVYMTIDGERRILTTSGSVFIPAGTKHCPLGFERVDRPFKFMAIALSGDGRYL